VSVSSALDPSVRIDTPTLAASRMSGKPSNERPAEPPAGGPGTINNGAPYTIGANSVVVLGPPFVFNATNIDQYVTQFGF